MITTEAFLTMCKAIQADKPSYKLGHDGDDGFCDCIGLIIGAIRRAGGKWTGTHGSNYAARNEMQELLAITSTAQLQPGMAVFKRWKPGDAKYDLPDGYKSGTDLGDYYHVGVVISIAPLQIMHCTSWTGGNGIKIDTTLGNWKWGGRLKKVAYDGQEGGEIAVIGYVKVNTPNGGILNIRDAAGKDIGDIPNGVTIPLLEKTSTDKWQVNYNGLVGYCAPGFLDEAQATTDAVTLVLSKAAAQELLVALQGQIK
jgi:hypothetical protein